MSAAASLLDIRSIYTALNAPRNSSPEEKDKLNSPHSVCLPGVITISKGSDFHKQQEQGAPPGVAADPVVAAPPAPVACSHLRPSLAAGGDDNRPVS